LSPIKKVSIQLYSFTQPFRSSYKYNRQPILIYQWRGSQEPDHELEYRPNHK